MAKKYDGVVETVRYAADGLIDTVRVYERRGPTFSDRILLNRDAFLQRLKSGKRFVTGQRKPLLASTFATGREVRVRRDNGRDWIVAGDGQGQQDSLEGVPLF